MKRPPALLRLMDANANRAFEGLRVCEELMRFHWKAPRAFRRLRALRHGLAKALKQLPVAPEQLVAARESLSDLGRDARPTHVSSLDQLLRVNLQRVKEALRTLEECSRLLAPRHTPAFQRLRFRTYDVERELIAFASRKRSTEISLREISHR